MIKRSLKSKGLLAILFGTFLIIFIAGILQLPRGQSKSVKPVANKESSKNAGWAKASIEEFMESDLDLEVLGQFDVPIGRVYEVATKDRHSFFHVHEKSKEVIYADIGGMEIRPADKEMLSRESALEIADEYVGDHKEEFEGFILADEQADYHWPKPTYWTFVWYTSPENIFEFAKVTVDAESGEIVAYGKGSDSWSTFCLPDKAQAGWANDQQI